MRAGRKCRRSSISLPSPCARQPVIRRTVLATAVLLTLGGATAAEAATFIVDSAADSGAGTLRQAMLDANASAGPHTIAFALPAGTTIGLTSGQIELVDGDVTIAGPGRSRLTISGNHASRIFHVKAGVLTLKSMTLRDGLALGDDSNKRDQRGGAIQVGEPATTGTGEPTPPGSVLPGLNLRDVAIFDSAAYSPADGGGGAVFSQGGALTIDHCLMQGNFARRAGGAVHARFGTVDVRDSQFLDNTVDFSADANDGEGGGMEINRGHAVISRSVFRGNRLTGQADGVGVGGGVSVLTQFEPVLIEDSEISDNDNSTMGLGFGGGLQCHEEPDGIHPTLTLRNSTVSGNTGLTGGVEAGCNLAIVNSTVTNNTTTMQGYGAGIEVYSTTNVAAARLTITSSIVAGNHNGPDLHQYLYTGYPNPVLAGAHALIGSADPDITIPAGTIYGIDPLLGPLDNNGGPTRTHALLSGSPAIDAGGNPLAGLLFDQRGVGYPRKVGAAVDIGAFERKPGNH